MCRAGFAKDPTAATGELRTQNIETDNLDAAQRDKLKAVVNALVTAPDALPASPTSIAETEAGPEASSGQHADKASGSSDTATGFQDKATGSGSSGSVPSRRTRAYNELESRQAGSKHHVADLLNLGYLLDDAEGAT